MIATIVIILTILGLWASWWVIRALARDIYSMDEADGTEARKNEKIRQEIERRRAGK